MYSDGNERSCGVCILFRKKLSLKPNDLNIIRDDEGRYLMVSFKIDHKEICIINVYAPNEDNPQFFIQLCNKLEQINADQIFLVGDLNVWLNPECDYKSKNKTPTITKSAS